MFPVIHFLRVRLGRIPFVTRGQGRSSCRRWTAVRMNSPATTLAAFGTGTFLWGFTTWTGRGGAPEGVSGFAVFVPKWTIAKVTIPATRISAENHGKSRPSRREPFRAAGVALMALRLDAISAVRLEDRRLPPDAPHLAERVAHLAHRHVGAGGLDDRRHEVVVLPFGSRLQPRERRLDRCRVAPRAQRPHALDLLALEGRIDAVELGLG